jgi:L-threonylcarbamoyladenylate synthase
VSKHRTENFKRKDRKLEILAAAAALQRGEVIVYPTETLYGLGADALNVAAVEKVLQLKGRDPNNPIPVLVADRTMLNSLVAEVPALAEKLIARFWPGPLTIVFAARKDIPRPLLNRAGGIGVRISNQPIAVQLAKSLGRPITATSANPSGKPPARTVDEAKKYFAGRIESYINGGELASRTGSTVVEIIANRIRIIREGEITREQLQWISQDGGVIR